MKLILLAAVIPAFSALAQAPNRGKPLGSWDVEYERITSHMHSEPTRSLERGTITLRSLGDSILGELRVGDSANVSVVALRGTASQQNWTLFAEEPTPHGIDVVFSAFASAMDWLRENVHGIHPISVRFDLVARGDSITGSRNVTGGMGAPTTAPVRGSRHR